VGQIGFILVGIGLGTPLGIMGALFHVLNHAMFKPLLFLNAGAVQYRLHTRDLRDMGGLENRMPVTATTSVVGALSISGIPPFNGFWSKLLIIVAAIQAQALVSSLLLISGSILTLALLLKIEKYAFFGTLSEQWRDIKEVPLTMRAAMIYLAVLCFGLGVSFPYVLDHIIKPAVNVLV
jgi:multicomponent Na+:H+ antiporter subunit D